VNYLPKKYKTVRAYIRQYPLRSMFGVFFLLLVLLLAGKLLQKAPADKQKVEVVKSVRVYNIGESPKATFQAKIEKTGVVKIIAQSGGIVQNVSVQEGQKVDRGQQLISLASNYQGGNAGALQRQIAQTQYQNVLDTYGQQKDLLQKQRDVANSTNENNQKLRDISGKSNDETKSLISSNQTLLDVLNAALSADPTNATISGQVNTLQGAVNQLKASQRSLEYQASGDNPPAKLGNLQKDITQEQLDVQEKALAVNRELSRLQLSLAYVNEATMYPASPFEGIVQRVYVHPGEFVSPGTLLAVIASPDVKTTVVLTIPRQIAAIISTGDPSELLIGSKKIVLTPYYVSSEATDGTLYSVFYDVPSEEQISVADGEYISVNVPVGTTQTSAAAPFVPIDAVYQTQENAFVLVTKNGKAETKIVKLGEVFGDYVEVVSGLTSGDRVILDRNVVAGDRVKL
jgi:HlyD family secretion protein